jgi:ABC-type nickel/cobalt efflux system permease component RcnA
LTTTTRSRPAGTAGAFDRVGLGLILLLAFSLGLASALMIIGLMVLYAKHFLPDTEKTRSHPVRLIPVFSAGLIFCIGLIMTATSLGAINPVKMVGCAESSLTLLVGSGRTAW